MLSAAVAAGTAVVSGVAVAVVVVEQILVAG